MPTNLPPRGPLTDQLVDFIKTHADVVAADIEVGDHTRPPRAGWQGVQPGQGVFIASVDVATGDAVPHHREAVRSKHTSWQMNYHLNIVGATRTQADHAADKIRDAVLDFPRGTYTTGWKVSLVHVPRLAPIRKDNPTDHPSYAIDDVVQVWVDREQT